MPQMAPMWWTSLMVMFILSMLMVMTTIYFNFKTSKMKQEKMKIKKMNWTW